jgi:hypothetical protein
MLEKQSIIQSKWVEELKDFLDHCPNSLLLWYLRRYGLPTFGNADFLVERIIHSFLIAEKLIGNEQEELQKQYPLPVGQTFKVLHNQINSLIESGEKIPDFIELVNFIDKISENGSQNIFFYRIRPKFANHLDDLRRKDYILESLKNQRYGHCYNRNRLIWTAKYPKLAEVRHKYEAGVGELFLKWVETRSWLQIIPKSVPPRYESRQERSVNFFRMDLKDGTAQIRIQKLQTRPHKTLEAELEIYCEEIGKLFNFDFYEPVPLEPIVKKLLRGRVLGIRYWRIDFPNGKFLKGTEDLNIFEILKIRFRNYSVRKIRGYWKNLDRIWGPENIYTNIDGKSNKLLITRHCDQLQIDSVLGYFKGLKKRPIKITEIKNLAKKRKDLEIILSSIDRNLDQSKDKKVSANELVALWYQIGFIKEAYEELVKISKKFKILKEKGEIILVYRTTSKGLIGFLERLFGMEFSIAQKNAVISLSFVIVIILLFWLNAWLFLPLIKEYVRGFWIVTLTCFINIALIFACALPIIGQDLIKDSIYLMGKIIEKIKKLFTIKKNS